MESSVTARSWSATSHEPETDSRPHPRLGAHLVLKWTRAAGLSGGEMACTSAAGGLVDARTAPAPSASDPGNSDLGLAEPADPSGTGTDPEHAGDRTEAECHSEEWRAQAAPVTAATPWVMEEGGSRNTITRIVHAALTGVAKVVAGRFKYCPSGPFNLNNVLLSFKLFRDSSIVT